MLYVVYTYIFRMYMYMYVCVCVCVCVCVRTCGQFVIQLVYCMSLLS